MAPGSSTSTVNELLLDFARTADDRELVRINPVRFAEQHGLAKAEAIDLFLHARKAGLLTMEWQYVCPGCGEVVERLTSLTSASSHFFCEICSSERDADLSDQSRSPSACHPEVRRSRYHDPLVLDPEEYFFRYRFTQSGWSTTARRFRDYLRRAALACAYLEPGATRDLLRCRRSPLPLAHERTGADRRRRRARTRCARFAFEYTGTRSEGFRANIDAGPVEIEFTNATDERYALRITSLPITTR